MVGPNERGREYADGLQRHVDVVRAVAARLPRRPKVYFEEWDEPQISAIAWVSELIGIAGGDDIFPERAQASLGRDRIVADPMDVVTRAPDIIIGSWCGKKFRPSAWRRAAAGARCPPCATASSTRSSRPSSCSPAGGIDRWPRRAAPDHCRVGDNDAADAEAALRATACSSTSRARR
jgi:hypothetical protein